MSPSSPVPIYVGIGATVVGFLLIVYAWAQVAGEEVVRKTVVAEEVSKEMAGEEGVGFEDQVGLGEEDEEDFL